MISNLYFLIKNFTYLSKNSVPKKGQIFFTYLYMILKAVLIKNYRENKTESIMGWKIRTFNYSTLIFLFGEIFVRGEYYFKSKTDEPVIFDCGANIGIATLFFKWLYPKSTIYSFEPDPQTFSLLTQNININHFKNIHLQNVALSEKEDKINFYISNKSPGSLKMSIHEERSRGAKVEVDSITLSSFIKKLNLPKIDFLKMDIEGSEIVVIEEMNKNGSLEIVDKMVIEYHHNMKNNELGLQTALQILSNSAFKYQIDAHNVPISSEGAFQDILIYVYR